MNLEDMLNNMDNEPDPWLDRLFAGEFTGEVSDAEESVDESAPLENPLKEVLARYRTDYTGSLHRGFKSIMLELNQLAREASPDPEFSSGPDFTEDSD